MSDMFTDRADFEDILESPQLLKLSHIIHKAFIEVNEEGAEAAAVTGYCSTKKRRAIFWKTFNADHPFLYYIIDTNTNTVLFSGRCKTFN